MWRPECKGSYGVFKVTSWKVLDGTQTVNKDEKFEPTDATRKTRRKAVTV